MYRYRTVMLYNNYYYVINEVATTFRITQCTEHKVTKMRAKKVVVVLCTVKPVYTVTCINQSPVVKGHLLLILAQKIVYELNTFYSQYLIEFMLLHLQFYVYVLQIIVCPFVLFLFVIALSVLLLKRSLVLKDHFVFVPKVTS